MAKTRNPQQDQTTDQTLPPAQQPIVTSPLISPVLSMQSTYGNSWMNGQMCGPGLNTQGGPYTLQPPPGGNTNPFQISPLRPTMPGFNTQTDPTMAGPAANQTGAKTNTPPDQKTTPDKQGDQVDPKVISAKADSLFKAMDGWGTDEDSVMGALKGLKPAEIEALKKQYQDHYGRSLDADLESELGGSDLAEAKAHLTSNPVDSALAALNNSTGFFNDDEAKIEQTLRDLKPEQLTELQKRAGTDPKTKEILDKVGGALGGGDKEVFDALIKGDAATADAVRMDEAMGSSSSGWNPLSWGTDEDKVYKLMEGKSETERKDMEAAFNKRMTAAGKQTDLKSQFTEEFSGAQKDIADSLLVGDQNAANAARLKDAAEGWGTNEDGIYALMEGKNDADRKALIESYEKKYGSLDAMLDDELSADDRERAKQLKETGELKPEFALKIATEGWGTDEAMLRKTLSGKSKDEIKTIREAWEKANPGKKLDDLVGDETSGRDEFELKMALEGEPTTPQEQYDRAQRTYEFERGTGSNWFSRGMMDGAELIGMHSKGSQLDRQMERMNGMFDENGNPKQGVTPQEVSKVYGYQQTDASNYKEAKDSVTDAVATGAEITAAAVATVLTDGAASPWLVAAIAGAAGGTAAMAVRYGMQGDAYGEEALYADLANIGVNALAGGLGETMFVANKLDDAAKGLAQVSSVFGDEFAQEVIKNGLKSAGQEGLKGFGQGAMNDKNWDAGMDQWLLGIGGNTLKGMGTGFVGGSAQQSVKTGFGMQTGFLQSAGVDGLAGAAQGLSTTMLDPSIYSGRPEDMFLKLAQGTGKGFAGGFIQGAADRQIRAGKVEHLLNSGADPSSIPELAHLSPAEQQRVLAGVLQHNIDNTDLSQLNRTPTIDTDKQIVLDPTQSPTNEPQVVTQGDDGKVTATRSGDDTNKVDATGKVTTPVSTDAAPDASGTSPKHPAVLDMESALATGDRAYVQKHLEALTSGKFDDALLETAVALPEMMKSMTPEQINMVGKHLFAEGHQLDALLRNGKKTGQQDGVNQYQKLTDAEIAQVKAQQDRSKMLGQSWSDELAKQGMNPFGNKIDQTLSITGEDWGKYGQWAKRIQDQTGSWTDMDLPSTMWSYQGNIDRYSNTHVNLFGGENGVRIFGNQRGGGPRMNQDGTMSSSVTANEVDAGNSVQFHGPAAQRDGYNMKLNTGLPGYGAPGFNATAPNIRLGSGDRSLGWMLWSWQNKVNNRNTSNPTK